MEEIKPYKESAESKKTQVSKMFDNVSSNYDSLNRVITFGMDVSWRKKLVKYVCDKNPSLILDVATGTADMPIHFAKAKVKNIIGVDISSGMLEVGKKKVANLNLQHTIQLELGDAENLPFENNTFDAVTVTYGIRNFEDLKKGMTEILRVLKPTGTLAILETSVPENFPFKQGYLLYTKGIMPLIGKTFSKDKKAYKYLSDSAINFPYGEKLKRILEEVGYKNVRLMPQAFGISTIYLAGKL